jgi:hypothetical protein
MFWIRNNYLLKKNMLDTQSVNSHLAPTELSPFTRILNRTYVHLFKILKSLYHFYYGWCVYSLNNIVDLAVEDIKCHILDSLL